MKYLKSFGCLSLRTGIIVYAVLTINLDILVSGCFTSFLFIPTAKGANKDFKKVHFVNKFSRFRWNWLFTFNQMWHCVWGSCNTVWFCAACRSLGAIPQTYPRLDGVLFNYYWTSAHLFHCILFYIRKFGDNSDNCVFLYSLLRLLLCVIVLWLDQQCSACNDLIK